MNRMNTNGNMKNVSVFECNKLTPASASGVCACSGGDGGGSLVAWCSFICGGDHVGVGGGDGGGSTKGGKVGGGSGGDGGGGKTCGGGACGDGGQAGGGGGGRGDGGGTGT